jgi:hypothetical protein
MLAQIPWVFGGLRREVVPRKTMTNGRSCSTPADLDKTAVRLEMPKDSLRGLQSGLEHFQLGSERPYASGEHQEGAQQAWKAKSPLKSYSDGLTLEYQFCGTLRTFVGIDRPIFRHFSVGSILLSHHLWSMQSPFSLGVPACLERAHLVGIYASRRTSSPPARSSTEG